MSTLEKEYQNILVQNWEIYGVKCVFTSNLGSLFNIEFLNIDEM